MLKKMRELLNKYSDFKAHKNILEELVESKGLLCLYFPEYHCELNPIERNWCHMPRSKPDSMLMVA